MSDSPVHVSPSPELSENLQARLRDLQELSEFVDSCRDQLSGVFAALGWSQDTGAAGIQEPMTTCPYDPHHRVPERSLEKHLGSCRLSKMGYSREEQDEMYDPSVCYEKANVPSVVIDRHLQQQIIEQARASAPLGRTEDLHSQSEYSTEAADVPQNHKHALCDLTVADRLAIYDYVLRETAQQRTRAEVAENDDLYVDLVNKLKKDDGQNGPKSHLEVLAEMRDYKRRRQSYRAKNVHITKKSYTEVIREVIDVHSGELARLWQEDKEMCSSKPSSHRRTSDAGRSASVESRHSPGSSRDAESSRRRRNLSRERDRDSRRKRESRSPDERHHDRRRRK
uniref:Small nuclear ribonucleoprotein 48 (U11/U12) n=1 Tax=Lepisosteus oculatus TaxID=7918 RepID=W5M9D6_LEPOC|nr:PREDICTED: U11/U12 small nuclear ribonucleoprotein 48 kDa protein isoform X2 [Lepisosteus oculatus]